MRVVPVDPADPELFPAFHEVYAAASSYGPQGEFAAPYRLDEVRISMTDPDQRRFRLGFAGLVDGGVVATGWLEGSTVDNLDLAHVFVCCAPERRGHGYAAAMLAEVEDQARSRGRSRLVAEVVWRYELGATGKGSDELAWAQRNGYDLALADVQRRLALPMPTARLDKLAAEAATHHQGYELRSFIGPVPDDLVEGWVALDALLLTEAPMGEIEREAEKADVAGFRASEAMVAAQGRFKVNTAALTATGEVVAYTDIAVTTHEAGRAYQWGTLVRADHRGHRLGLAVKVANLRLLQETSRRSPSQITTVVTYNADVNAPMVAVNDQLGFRPVSWLGELQKRLS